MVSNEKYTKYFIDGSGLGGGVISFKSWSVTISGQLKANAETIDSGAGGGSGGSIYISTGTFGGNGNISADGGQAGLTKDGNFFCGAGSGGRIAIHYSSSSFNGNITALGGIGHTPSSNGGPGTIFTNDTSKLETKLLISNGGHSTPLQEIIAPNQTTGTIAWLTNYEVLVYRFDQISIKGSAGLAIVGSNIISFC